MNKSKFFERSNNFTFYLQLSANFILNRLTPKNVENLQIPGVLQYKLKFT
ncbi:hypothetical protein GCWU000322_00323 [Eubacterium saphenum ATCC 49989]|nr:hypothetical protein GCWU000322_00323 [Eubacterium saphenum ATCC 49989]